MIVHCLMMTFKTQLNIGQVAQNNKKEKSFYQNIYKRQLMYSSQSILKK
jgi:hypothetical protein